MAIPDITIPEGKIISTIHGDPRALELSMEKLKKFGFTGYILTRMKHDGYISEGYLVIKDGNLLAAIYGRRVEGKFIVTKKGEEALKLSWGDTYDNMCDLEVHGRLDINVILQIFPMSRIDTKVEKKTLKRRTRFSLEWGNNGQGEAAEEIGPLPEELRKKLEDWRNEGYVVKFLQEEIQKDPNNAATAFEQFESNVKRAEFLKLELDSLDCKHFANDVERLKAMIKNPSKITTIEAALQGLKLKVEQEKAKEKEEKLAELMAQADIKHDDVPKAEAPPQSAEENDIEEKLAGQGDIIPPARGEGNRCTICGAELYGKEECPTCGAGRSAHEKEPMPVGDSNLIPEYTFENFILGESNRFSHSAALAVSKPGTSTYNPLFICSGTGLGKTHLLNAIGHFVISNYPDKKVLYISAEGFINEFVDVTKNNRKKQFRKKFHDLDFLLLDDIQLIVNQEAAQDELYQTLSALFKAGKQIVITCDKPIREIAGMKERLMALFDSGLPTEMHPPDLKTRHEILKVKARIKKIDAGDDVLQFIAERHRANIRMLEGALKTLLAYTELMKVPMTLETAKLALKDDIPENMEPELEAGMPERAIPFEKIVERLKISHSYLIEEVKPVKCFEHFVDNLNLGMRGLALTRINPKRLREQYDLGGATVLWLTDKEGDAENRVVPVLEKIIYRIEDFLNTPGKSILLLDGLDYLISNNNFDSVLRFLRRLIDEVSESDAIFITSITPETLDQQALNILEREMEILSFL
ncbi:MAG: DnaA/Hda family protein [Thermoplasmata archaeon]